MTRTMRLGLGLLALGALPFASHASGQSPTDWKYEVGLRSTFMVTDMRLSELGQGFEDLGAGGKALPHSSSLFVMWPLGDHVRVGVETLVGNSFADGSTEMMFQASGVTAEYQTGGTWFVAAGVQAGGMLASATYASDASATGDVLRSGAHYKDSGKFVAPQAALGRLVGRYDVRLVAKRVWQFGADEFDAFDSFYAGISVGLMRR